MKKRIVLILILAALIAALVVAPVSARGGLTLLGAKVSKAGATFTFKVHKEFNKFTGTAYYGGQAYPLSCKLKEDNAEILVCVGVKTLASKYVLVVVNGHSFETYVTERQHCNPVYDIVYEPIFADALADGTSPIEIILIGEIPWTYYGDYCSETKPDYGDWVELSGYYPVGSWWYEFKSNGACPGVNEFGQGWYWDGGECGLILIDN